MVTRIRFSKFIILPIGIKDEVYYPYASLKEVLLNMKRNEVEEENCEMNLFIYLIESADFRH